MADFNHKNFESKWYKKWQEKNEFSCDINSARQSYTIMMPPPNVTGSLHIGHALTFTLQDILTRYHRMNDCDVLWQPGTDHAGIATQMVVERMLSQENIDRRDIGREKFIRKVWEWKNISGNKITDDHIPTPPTLPIINDATSLRQAYLLSILPNDVSAAGE